MRFYSEMMIGGRCEVYSGTGVRFISRPLTFSRDLQSSRIQCIESLDDSLQARGLSMGLHPGSSAAKARAGAGEAVGTTRTSRTAPATILLVAIWIGLIAGFLDLGLLIFKKRLTGDDFYRLGDQFRWIIPAGVCMLVLLPGTVLALISCVRRGRFPWVSPWGCCHSSASSIHAARLPLGALGVVLFSGGLAVQSARWSVARREPFVGLVRRTAATRRRYWRSCSERGRPCLV